MWVIHVVWRGSDEPKAPSPLRLPTHFAPVRSLQCRTREFNQGGSARFARLPARSTTCCRRDRLPPPDAVIASATEMCRNHACAAARQTKSYKKVQCKHPLDKSMKRCANEGGLLRRRRPAAAAGGPARGAASESMCGGLSGCWKVDEMGRVLRGKKERRGEEMHRLQRTVLWQNQDSGPQRRERTPACKTACVHACVPRRPVLQTE